MNQPTSVGDIAAFHLFRTIAVLVNNGLPSPTTVAAYDQSILVRADDFPAWSAELNTEPPAPVAYVRGSRVWATPRNANGIQLMVVTWNDDEIRAIGAEPVSVVEAVTA